MVHTLKPVHQLFAMLLAIDQNAQAQDPFVALSPSLALVKCLRAVVTAGEHFRAVFLGSVGHSLCHDPRVGGRTCAFEHAK
jgi:hypothetical protein